MTNLIAGILVLLWVRWSRTPWAEIGFVRPRSWGRSLAVGVVFGISFKILMKTIVMRLLGADPINPSYHYLVGNTAALPAMVLTVIFGAGFGEETVYRGYLFQRLGRLFGSGRWAKAVIVILTAAVFGLAHYSGQGLPGAEQAIIVGLVFGVIFAATGQLWMLMCAHVAFDLTAVAIIYWNLETAAAHLILG